MKPIHKDHIRFRSVNKRILVLHPNTKKPKIVFSNMLAVRAHFGGLSFPTIRQRCQNHTIKGGYEWRYAHEWENENSILLPGAMEMLPI